MNKKAKHEKILTVVFVTLLLLLCALAVFYTFCGKSIIEAAYDGRSLPALNKLIKYQHTKPVEHYLELADILVKRGISLFLAILATGSLFFFIVQRLMFSQKTLRIGWVVLFSLLPQNIIFILNPTWRLYYRHAFFRGGIVYQILSSGIPPNDPLFAGEIVHSPWGGPCLVAMISAVLNITPSQSFAIINSIAICLITILVYKISRLVFEDKKSAVCSAFFAIFASTIFPANTIIRMGSVFHSGHTEYRAMPFFMKFPTDNGNPTGMIFFLVFVYAAILLVRNHKNWLPAFLLVLGVSGCTFFYPPMFPGLVSSVALFLLVHLFLARGRILSPSVRPSLYIAGLSFIPIVALKSYLFSSSSGPRTSLVLFDIENVLPKIISLSIVLLPVLILIAVNWKWMSRSLEKKALLLLLSIIVANIGVYMTVNLLDHVEYKFFIIAGFMAGILGGISFYRIRLRLPAFWALIIFLLFMLPSFDTVIGLSKRYGNNPLINFKPKWAYEEGMYYYSDDREERQLYDWIRNNTPADSVFIDSNLKLPVFAQRRLLVGFDGNEGKVEGGYGVTMDVISRRNAYDKEEYRKRREIVENILGFSDTLDRTVLLEYLHNKKIYVLVRKRSFDREFNTQGLREAFATLQGSFSVYTRF